MSSEYDVEPIRGLPETPPEGEAIIWQGAPQWTTLAIRAFHVRKVAIYFGIVWAWLALRALGDNTSFAEALVPGTWLIIPAVSAITILGGLAWFYARTTVYTITSERVVIRSGLALPMTVNLPFTIVDSAGWKRYADGSGDLSLQLQNDQRASYTVLWPNVRPWHFTKPEPTLRCLENSEEVSQILVEALSAKSEPVGELPRIRKEPDMPQHAIQPSAAQPNAAQPSAAQPNAAQPSHG